MYNSTTRVTKEPLGSQIGRFTFDTSSFLNLSSEACSPSLISNFLYFNNVARGAKRTVSLSSKLGGGGYRFRDILYDFNRAVRFHCERIPLGFASLQVGDGNGDGNNGGYGNGEGDGNGVGGIGNGTVVEDDGLELKGSGCGKPKKVLILMSDTGGGHRASAEAIKAAFYQEYGDDYQVLFVY